MNGETRIRTAGLLFFLGVLLVSFGSSVIAFRVPTARVWFPDRGIGMKDSHRVEKYATGLFANAIGIVGTCLALRRRVIPGFGLIGACYFLDAARREVFHVWEGGRLFDKDYLIPWIYMMLGLLMFWVTYREYQKRQEAGAVLEEVPNPGAGGPGVR